MQFDSQKFIHDSIANLNDIGFYWRQLPYIEEADEYKVFQAWTRGGLLGVGEEKGVGRSWGVVGPHQIVVARVGYFIARTLRRPLEVEKVTPYMLCLALLDHDFEKPEDVRWVGATQTITYEAYEKKVLDGIEELTNIGFSPMVARLAGVSNEYGLDKILNGTATLAEMVAFYADMTVSGTNATSYNARNEALERSFSVGGMYENWKAYYRVRYGEESHGKLWGKAGDIVAAEFTKHLGEHDFLGTPPEHLKLR